MKAKPKKWANIAVPFSDDMLGQDHSVRPRGRFANLPIGISKALCRRAEHSARRAMTNAAMSLPDLAEARRTADALVPEAAGDYSIGGKGEPESDNRALIRQALEAAALDGASADVELEKALAVACKLGQGVRFMREYVGFESRWKYRKSSARRGRASGLLDWALVVEWTSEGLWLLSDADLSRVVRDSEGNSYTAAAIKKRITKLELVRSERYVSPNAISAD